MSNEPGEGPDKQEALPKLERGTDLSRIFAFTDGVFAIAITLLVLQIDVPTGATGDSSLWSALKAEGTDFAAFAVSFLVIGMYWVDSHRSMRKVKEYDRGLMLLTLLYLFFVVLIPFSSQLLGEYGDVAPVSVVIYIVNLVCVSLSVALMQRHVIGAGIGKEEYDWDNRLSLKSSWFTTAVFVATVPLVFLIGPWAPAVWVLLRFDPYQRRRDRAYEKSATAG